MCKKDKITPLQEITYFCKDGKNDYKTTFAIFGFQYIEVEADMEIHPEDFKAIAVYSGFETTFTFDSSNALLNQFVKNTLWSLKIIRQIFQRTVRQENVMAGQVMHSSL